MKAIVRARYGSPDVLHVEEIERPAPDEDQVLVEVRAASVNALDWHTLSGKPFVGRLAGSGLLRPREKILGADIAGRVVAVGRNVKQFKPEDEVFGFVSGGFAEYACAREKYLALKPDKLSFEEAAAVPVAAVTALQALRDKGKIQPGQTVLVNGASGGVGTFAVQIAKSYGAEVTGVCSSRNLDKARPIGADHVIDYKQEDFTRSGRLHDLICDVASNRSVRNCKRALSPKGTCVIVGFSSRPRLLEHMVMGHCCRRRRASGSASWE